MSDLIKEATHYFWETDHSTDEIRDGMIFLTPGRSGKCYLKKISGGKRNFKAVILTRGGSWSSIDGKDITYEIKDMKLNHTLVHDIEGI